MAAAPGIFPGVKTQWRSGGCSADISRRDMVAAHTWLQRRIFPGAKMQRGSGSCSANVPGREVVAARARLQCRAICRA